jgi:hypothetical protein
MKKAIVIDLALSSLGSRKGEQMKEASLSELNQHLAEGWTVLHSFPMSGTQSYYSATVVILERE